MTTLPILAFALVLGQPALAQDAAEPAAEEPAAAEPAPEPTAAEKALAAVPGLYATRDRAGVGAKAIALLDAAIAEEPDNVELRWQVARFLYWEADNASSSDAGAAYAKTCWDHAEHLKTIAPGQIHGHYWAMACIGAYSENMGIVTAVKQGLAGKFEENGLKAVSINPSHDHGGPLRGLGRFHDQLPWPLRDADKSREYLERALKAGPEHARNLYFMADLEVEEGNEDAARPYLERVLALTPAGSGNPPEVRKFQAKAKAMLAELDS